MERFSVKQRMGVVKIHYLLKLFSVIHYAPPWAAVENLNTKFETVGSVKVVKVGGGNWHEIKILSCFLLITLNQHF